MERAGVSPFVCTDKSVTKAEARRRLESGYFLVPNLSGFYHGILRDWWERHGLGDRSLLISETHAVAEVFAERYAATKFVTTDYFVSLQPKPTCDFVWDLCSAHVPDEARGSNSIICQATLEHIIDPVQVMRNLTEALEPEGMLYVQTHTPAYPYHGWPKDYMRYFPEWFEDIAGVVRLQLVELLCVDGHAFAAYRKPPD